MCDDAVMSPSSAAAADCVQKKTFGKWINNLLRQDQDQDQDQITDLYHDLRDGLVLLRLLGSLTGRPLRRERGSLRVHKLSNVALALSVLKEEKVRLVNVNNVDIVDGNPKITLALVWAIILHWQFHSLIKEYGGEEGMNTSGLERCLLAWCRQWTRKYRDKYGVDVRDFGQSWTDGKAFCSLIHAHKPDLVGNIHQVLSDEEFNAKKRLQLAFNLAEEHLSIPQLLDADDLSSNDSRPDKKSLMTYLMCLFQALPHEDIDLTALDDLSSRESASNLNCSSATTTSPLPKSAVKNLKQGERDLRPFCATAFHSMLHNCKAY